MVTRVSPRLAAIPADLRTATLHDLPFRAPAVVRGAEFNRPFKGGSFLSRPSPCLRFPMPRVKDDAMDVWKPKPLRFSKTCQENRSLAEFVYTVSA